MLRMGEHPAFTNTECATGGLSTRVPGSTGGQATSGTQSRILALTERDVCDDRNE
jgi:hypothetical protein